MPRALQTSVLFLLLGAILAILFAWATCITIKTGASRGRPTRSRPMDSLAPVAWPHASPPGLGPPTQYTRTSGWDFTTDCGLWSHSTTPDHELAINIVMAGLPFRCVQSTYRGEWQGLQTVHSEFQHALHFDLPFAAATLPWAPRWPGLLANAALFGALSWLLLRGPHTLHRFRHRHTPHCPTCHYDRTGLAPHTPCPECGLAPS